MSLADNLIDWRKNRNITKADTKDYIANVIEELLEIFTQDKKEIQLIQKHIISTYFDREPLSKENTIDAIQDIQVFSINETELMGYDNKQCNDEVFKEINSREQCPMQKEIWDNWGADGKWKKSTTQDKSTLYKANYSKCKRVQDEDK